MIKNEDKGIKTKCCGAISITVFDKNYIKQYSYCKKCGKIYYRVPVEEIKKEQEKKIKENKKREKEYQRRMREFERGINVLAAQELNEEWDIIQPTLRTNYVVRPSPLYWNPGSITS